MSEFGKPKETRKGTGEGGNEVNGSADYSVFSESAAASSLGGPEQYEITAPGGGPEEKPSGRGWRPHFMRRLGELMAGGAPDDDFDRKSAEDTPQINVPKYNVIAFGNDTVVMGDNAQVDITFTTDRDGNTTRHVEVNYGDDPDATPANHGGAATYEQSPYDQTGDDSTWPSAHELPAPADDQQGDTPPYINPPYTNPEQ